MRTRVIASNSHTHTYQVVHYCRHYLHVTNSTNKHQCPTISHGGDRTTPPPWEEVQGHFSPSKKKHTTTENGGFERVSPRHFQDASLSVFSISVVEKIIQMEFLSEAARYPCMLHSSSTYHRRITSSSSMYQCSL